MVFGRRDARFAPMARRQSCLFASLPPQLAADIPIELFLGRSGLASAQHVPGVARMRGPASRPGLALDNEVAAGMVAGGHAGGGIGGAGHTADAAALLNAPRLQYTCRPGALAASGALDEASAGSTGSSTGGGGSWHGGISSADVSGSGGRRGSVSVSTTSQASANGYGSSARGGLPDSGPASRVGAVGAVGSLSSEEGGSAFTVASNDAAAAAEGRGGGGRPSKRARTGASPRSAEAAAHAAEAAAAAGFTAAAAGQGAGLPSARSSSNSGRAASRTRRAGGAGAATAGTGAGEGVGAGVGAAHPGDGSGPAGLVPLPPRLVQQLQRSGRPVDRATAQQMLATAACTAAAAGGPSVPTSRGSSSSCDEQAGAGAAAAGAGAGSAAKQRGAGRRAAGAAPSAAIAAAVGGGGGGAGRHAAGSAELFLESQADIAAAAAGGLIDRATVRRAWNRLNARNSRERKRFMMDSLSGRIDTLAAENRAMVELASAAGLGRELHAFLQSGAPAPAPAPAAAGTAAEGVGRSSGGGSGRGARAAAALASADAVPGQTPQQHSEGQLAEQAGKGGGGRQQGQPASSSSSTAAEASSSGGQGGVISAELSGADFALVEVVTTCQRHFLITDPTAEDNPIVFASAGFYQLTGYSPQEILGRNCRFLQGRDTDAEAVAYMRYFISRGQDVAVVLLNYRRDGTPFYNELFVAPLKGADGAVIHFVGVQSDIPTHLAAAKLPAQGRRIAEWRAKHPERGPLPPAIAAARAAGHPSGVGVAAAVADGGVAAADGSPAQLQQQQLAVAPGATSVTATA